MNKIYWEIFLENQKKEKYMQNLLKFIDDEYSKFIVYPPKENIFEALKLTPYEQVKVVILGQDPYPNEGQAHGLSFSVQDGVAIPRSLKNIFKVIYGEENMPKNGNLSAWARQGVLLLNNVLTVRAKETGSHFNVGWEIFTANIISTLNQHETPIVFLLWGKQAEKKANLITNSNHLILTAPHPSPLSASRGFFECDHFNKANIFLEKHNIEKIDWKSL